MSAPGQVSAVADNACVCSAAVLFGNGESAVARAAKVCDVSTPARRANGEPMSACCLHRLQTGLSGSGQTRKIDRYFEHALVQKRTRGWVAGVLSRDGIRPESQPRHVQLFRGEKLRKSVRIS